MVWALIAVNGLVFLFELSLNDEQREALVHLFGIVPARFSHPAWAEALGFPADDCWPFITSMFLHGGWMHIIGNMWALWIFGDNVEDRMGSLRFLIFYMLCGLLAGIMHWFTNPYSTIPAIGASGAIAGVLGAYLVLFPTARVIAVFPIFFLPFFFDLPAVTYLAIWFFTQLFSGTVALLGPEQVQGVAWWAHVGGFLAGIIVHRLFLHPDRQRRFYADELDYRTAWRPRDL